MEDCCGDGERVQIEHLSPMDHKSPLIKSIHINSSNEDIDIECCGDHRTNNNNGANLKEDLVKELLENDNDIVSVINGNMENNKLSKNNHQQHQQHQQHHHQFVVDENWTPNTWNATGPKASTEKDINDEQHHIEDDIFCPSKINIMVVDDDIVSRTLLKNTLKKVSYNVTIVSSAEEAWNILISGEIKYSLVLADVIMPLVSGFDLLQRINDHPTIKNIPVILMSGTALNYTFANDTIKIGGQDFVTKPIAMELLKKKIDTLLRSKHQKRKEKRYKASLAHEKERHANLAKEMEAKEIEIKELTRRMNEMSTISREALETPLESVTRNIEELMNHDNLTDNQLKPKLNYILKLLGSSNLYRPSLEKLMSNEYVDPVTKSFLASGFSSSMPNTDTSTDTSFPQATEYGENNETKICLKKWEFDIFLFSETQLMPLIVEMFENYGLLTKFNIPLEKLHRFIMTVYQHYRLNNRYHNFLHAFDVLQTCYTLLTTFKADQYLTHLDILSLLIGSICHDVDHPGVNNNFQVNAQTDLSFEYNDNSVLENHHARLTFKILREPNCNILKELSVAEYKEVRRSIISLILATDMNFHYEYINKFQHHLNNQPFDRNNSEDRQMILNYLIKCGDISNVAKPWTLNFEWSNRVSDEFFEQASFEKEHGLPVAPFMDRQLTSRPKIAADFIDYVAGPLFQGLSTFLPKCQVIVETMKDNRQRWQLQLDKSCTPQTPLSPFINSSSSNHQTSDQDNKHADIDSLSESTTSCSSLLSL